MKELLIRFIPLVLSVISPELRKFLEEMLNTMETKAKTTPNPWDDYFVAALRVILLGER